MVINAAINIIVDLEPGVYLLPEYSGSGKTYLYNLLMTLRDGGVKVSGFTYRDVLNKSKIEDVIPIDTELCVIDRYDMYRGEYIPYIKKLARSCIVLIDLKGVFDLKIPDIGIANISLYSDRIVVS